MGLESKLLKFASVCNVFNPEMALVKKLLDAFDVCCKLHAVEAPDWGEIFEDWPDIRAIHSQLSVNAHITSFL